VALGHSGIFVPEHGRDGTSDDVAPSQNDSTQTFDRDSSGLEQPDDTGWCARGKQGDTSARGEVSNVVCVKALRAG